MEFICRYCGKRKGEGEEWLLALEGTGKPGKVMKYAITLLGKWDEQRAGERNAVHFCSASCQNKYLRENYGDQTWGA
ncbi:MAG TPA: hypothetical protein VEG30_06795 [Terriglobales bacterium]|nr:hypothetical protein [Terriglobales bacterium]